MPFKTLFISSSQATTSDLTQGIARWSLSAPLSFTNREGIIPEIAVHSMSYSNFFINISSALGNNVFYMSDDALDATKYTLSIPDGSYDATSLNDIVVDLQLATAAVEAFNFVPNYSTNRLEIVFKLAGWFVNIVDAGTALLLGFAIGFYPADQISAIGEGIDASAVARLNNVETVCVATNLSNEALSGVGLNQSNIIYRSVPNTPVGFTVSDTVQNLLWIQAPTLAGSVSELVIQLVDQSGTPINTVGEQFNVCLLIKY